ncbi:PHP-associated domain-containing protein [Halovivax cerinus]|uniref:PHP-associated domain-containing protein n=1 Tax=Halovivax cerinus TaxID=1487865 RepID=A0ABD5NLT9_9EURY|nr:PHP-associated domain-containing protein [Halovivax cerinus]
MVTPTFCRSVSAGVPAQYCADLHVKVLSDRVVARAKRLGLDALVYAPHFTPLSEIEATAARYADDELAIVPAREIFTGTWRDRKHVLALGLEGPIPDFITLEGAMAEFDRQNAVVLVPHPTFATVSLGPGQIRQYRDSVDAIEVFNPKHLPMHNRRAATIAAELDLPVYTSSYAHLTRSIGLARTVFPTEIDAESGLLDALEDGADRRIDHADGVRRWLGTGSELAHLVWENTWEKARRIPGPEIEPTHPDDPRYEGRFDDVSVY